MLQSIKDTLKKNIPFVQKLLLSRNKHKCRNDIINNIDNYKSSFLQYSTSYPDYNNPSYQRRVIIINSHILEKGLSHSDFRPGFGKNVVKELEQNLKKYKENNGNDIFAINNAVSLLKIYHQRNKKFGYDDSSYLDWNFLANEESADLSPYNIITDSKCLNMSFDEFSKKRHAIRVYERDGLPISKELINKVISLANTAPSACNRQATHIFVFSDKKVLSTIEAIHGGCKGFGRHASAFLIVTSDLSLYSSNEPLIPSYDAGIYTMNLLYALQTYGLYSCALNGSFPGKKTKQIHKVTKIPDNYYIFGLIAVYKFEDGITLSVAASPRRTAEDIVSFE